MNKKKAIASLADAIYKVRSHPSAPFDADFAFGAVCSWALIIFRAHISSGQSRFGGSFRLEGTEVLAKLQKHYLGDDHARKAAHDAAVVLMGAMALFAPFKNVLAMARKQLIRSKGVAIDGAWSVVDQDRGEVKDSLEGQIRRHGECGIMLVGDASGATALEAMAIKSQGLSSPCVPMTIRVLCETPVPLLIAITQVMFASILHTYAEVRIVFNMVNGGDIEKAAIFEYSPVGGGSETLFAA